MIMKVELYSQRLDDLCDDPLTLELPATEEQLAKTRKDLGIPHGPGTRTGNGSKWPHFING